MSGFSKTEIKKLRAEFKERCKLVRQFTLNDLKTQTETAQQQAARLKRFAKPAHYIESVEYYFGGNSPHALVNSPSAAFHQLAYKWLFEMKTINLLNCIHRDGAKSVHANIFYPFHLKQFDLMKFMLVVGANETRAQILLADLQVQFEANEKIIRDFGMQLSYGNWEEGMFETQDGSFFMALGIDQPFRGLRRYANRVQYCNIDDVEDREKALNQEIVSKRINKIKRDLGGAYSKEVQREVFSNNYIVKNGLMDAYIKAKRIPVSGVYKGKPNPYSKKLWIPAVDKAGNSMWKERYSNDYWKAKKENTDYFTWESEYMHNPVEEGKLIKAEWVRYKRPKKLENYEYLLGRWDMAYSQKGDYFVYILMGFTGGEFHVLQTFVQQCTIAEAMAWHFENQADLVSRGIYTDNYYDAAVSQEAIFEPMWQNASNEHGAHLDVPQPDKGTATNKFLLMASVLVNVFKSGKLFFAQALEKDLYCQLGIEQLLALEKGSKAHDDFPDDLARVVQLIRQAFSQDAANVKPSFVELERGGY